MRAIGAPPASHAALLGAPPLPAQDAGEPPPTRRALLDGLTPRIRGEDERAAFGAWWETRSVRERRLLALLGAIVLALGLWYGLAAPIRAMERDAAEEHARAVERLMAVSGAAREVQALQTARGSTGGRPLAAVVSQTALASSVPIARQGLEGENGLAVGVDRVDPGALFRWIAVLGRDHGVSVGGLEMTRNADATLRARVVFNGDAV